MGVIHKLKPEVKDFLLAQKNENSSLSCRKLAALVQENFQIELSKSSINFIIKQAGLSAPIGRTPKKKKQRITMPQLPVLLEDSTFPKEPQKQDVQAEEKRIVEEEAKRKLQEETTRKAEEAKWQRLAAEESRLRKLEEERFAKERAEAERQKKELAEAEAKKRQLEEEARLRQLEEERQKEELRRQQEAAAEQAKAAEAERLRLAKVEEEKHKAEEEARLRKLEEERLAKEAVETEQKRKEEEAHKAEESRKAEEKRIVEEEAKRKLQEETTRKAEEEKQRAEESAKPAMAIDIGILPQLEDSGTIFLRSVDSLLGASRLIAAAVKNRVSIPQGNLEDLVEDLIYLPMVKDRVDPQIFNKLESHLAEMEGMKVLNLDISRIIASSLQEARCAKIVLSDNSNIYLDGTMYSVWSSPHIPYDFASPFNRFRKYIAKYFTDGYPLVLFNAPGYDMPSKEFLSFLTALEAKDKSIKNLVIYGNKFEELEVLHITTAKVRNYIFAVWPWQFNDYRRVKTIGDFRSYRLEEQEKDFYIADIEMELNHPNLIKPLVFYGCALKLNLNEKARLIILSNFTPEAKKCEELAAIYLNHWPNLEETFQDYSHKIELFTYTANSQRYFDLTNLNLKIDQTSSIRDLFRDYLTVLDAYIRWHLLPGEYEDKAFTDTKERFYDLALQLTKQEKSCLARLALPSDYDFGKDLSYLCRRINEKEAYLSGNLKLYFK